MFQWVLFPKVLQAGREDEVTWEPSDSAAPPLDPHICWNCTRISANVSMITAMNTFCNQKVGVDISSK